MTIREVTIPSCLQRFKLLNDVEKEKIYCKTLMRDCGSLDLEHICIYSLSCGSPTHVRQI